MNGAMCFKKWFIFIWLCFGIVLFSAQESLAQFGRISIRGSIGTGYLPLSDWGDFFGQGESSHYVKDRFGSYWEVGIAYHITEKHVMAFTVGGIKTSASLLEVMMIFYLDGDTTGFAAHVAEWDFRTTPLNLSYEFYPVELHRKNSPFFGVGVSYLLSELEAKAFGYFDSPFREWTQQGTRDGKGYGFHVYLGLQSQITPHVYFISRLRGQYADGMGFTDKKGNIKVEFTGIDLTFGVSWKL